MGGLPSAKKFANVQNKLEHYVSQLFVVTDIVANGWQKYG